MKKKLKKFKLEAKKKIPIARTHLAKPIAKKIPNQNLSTSTQQFLAQICFMKASNYPQSKFLRRACRW